MLFSFVQEWQTVMGSETPDVVPYLKHEIAVRKQLETDGINSWVKTHDGINSWVKTHNKSIENKKRSLSVLTSYYPMRSSPNSSSQS